VQIDKQESELNRLGRIIRERYKDEETFKTKDFKEVRDAFKEAYIEGGGNPTLVPSYWQRIVYQYAFPGLKYVSNVMYKAVDDKVVVDYRKPKDATPEVATPPPPLRPSSPLLMKAPLVSVETLVGKMKSPPRIIVVAKSESGKSVLTKEILQHIHYDEIQILTGSDVEQWEGLGRTQKWDASTLDDIIAKHKKKSPRPFLMIVLDDVGADNDAKYNATLDGLFQLGRHDAIGVVVLSQQGNLLLTPTRRNNASVVLWSKLDTDQQSHVLKTTALPVSASQFKSWMFDFIGPSRDYTFGAYIENAEPPLYKVRANLTKLKTYEDEEPDDDVRDLESLLESVAVSDTKSVQDSEPKTPKLKDSKAWGTYKQGGSNQKKKPDQYWTMPHSIDPLVKYLVEFYEDPTQITIWEPCHGEGGLTNPLRTAGFNVISTDLYTLPEHISFINCKDEDGVEHEECEVPEGVDLIVTNPPFSYKNAFLERFFKLGIQTMVILPLDILGTKRDLALLKENGFNLYMLPGASASSVFYNKEEDRAMSVGTCAWYGLNLGVRDEIHYL